MKKLAIATFALLFATVVAHANGNSYDLTLSISGSENTLVAEFNIHELSFVEEGAEENILHMSGRMSIENSSPPIFTTFNILRKDGTSNVCVMEPQKSIGNFLKHVQTETNLVANGDVTIDTLRPLTSFEITAARKFLGMLATVDGDSFSTLASPCSLFDFTKSGLTAFRPLFEFGCKSSDGCHLVYSCTSGQAGDLQMDKGDFFSCSDCSGCTIQDQ